jgi:hypothetical protein
MLQMPRTQLLMMCITVGLLASSLPGCGGREGDVETAIDSMGVRIVNNGPIDDRIAAHLDAPVYQLGWDSSDRPWERVTTGALLPSGHAAIGDVGSMEVVIIGESGEVLEVSCFSWNWIFEAFGVMNT